MRAIDGFGHTSPQTETPGAQTPGAKRKNMTMNNVHNMVPLLRPAKNGLRHSSRDADVQRTAEEILADFLAANASPDLPYRMRVEAAMMSDPNLSDAAKVVGYHRLKASDRETGKNSYQSARTIGVLANKGIRQVERCDTALEDAGYMSRQRRRNMTSNFTMISPEDIERVLVERPQGLRNDRFVASGTSETTQIDTSQPSTNDRFDASEAKDQPTGDKSVVSEAASQSRNDKIGIEKRQICRLTPVNTPEVEQAESLSQITTVESSAASLRASAREEAEEAAGSKSFDLVEGTALSRSKALTPVQARKAANRAVGKQLNGKRQPDLLVAANITGTAVAVAEEEARQVVQALTCWFDAMAEQWAGVRVSKRQRRGMLQLINEEGFDYVLALGGKLTELQFGKGQGSGWIIELNDLLFDADKRDKVFGKYQRGPLVRGTATPQKPAGMPDKVWQEIQAGEARKAEAAAPTRFDASKPAANIHRCYVSGEDANDILDAVVGSTRNMVRAALKAASDQNASKFEGDEYKPAQLAPLLRWVTDKVKWVVAYANHGDVAKLAGGDLAKFSHNGWGCEQTETFLYPPRQARAAISQAFLDGLKAQFPQAWAENVKHMDRWQNHKSIETGSHCALKRFQELALSVTPDSYGPESQKVIEDGMAKWAREKQEEVLKVLADNEIFDAEQRETLVRDREKIVQILRDSNKSEWGRLGLGQYGMGPVWREQEWGPCPDREGCLVPQDIFDEVSAIHEARQHAAAALEPNMGIEFVPGVSASLADFAKASRHFPNIGASRLGEMVREVGEWRYRDASDFVKGLEMRVSSAIEFATEALPCPF